MNVESSNNLFDSVAVGLQADADPVKCPNLIDATSCSLKTTRTIKQYEGMGGGRLVTRSGVGPHTVGGDIALNVTPDKISQLLYAMLHRLDVNTSTAVPISHVFRPETREGQVVMQPITLHVRRGMDFWVYPNCYPERLVFRPSEEDDLTATLTVAGLANEKLYNTSQLDAAAAYSSLAPFAFHGATVKQCAYGGTLAVTSLTSGWSIDIPSGFQSRRMLGDGLVAVKGRAGRSRVSGSFDLLFESDAEYVRWMGDSTTVYPKSPGTALSYLVLQIIYTHATSSAVLTIDIPRALLHGEATPPTQSAEGYIVQPLSFVTEGDATTEADVKITLANAETNAVITTAGTKIV